MRYSMRFTFCILLLLVAFCATAQIVNNPPVVGNIRIVILDGSTNAEVSRQPIAGDRLKAGYTFFDVDPEDNEFNSILEWYRNDSRVKSVQVSGEQGRTLPFDLSINKGESWYFKITPRDGKDDGVTEKSNTVTVGNASPRATSVSIKPSNPNTMDDLEANYVYYDSDGDLEGNTEILWYKDVNDNYILQPFHNQKTLPFSATERGDKWRYSVRPRDLDGARPDDFVNSAPVTVRNAVPEVEILSVTGSRDDNGYFYGDITVMYNLKDEDGDLCDLRLVYRGGTASSSFSTAAYAVESGGRDGVANIGPDVGLRITWKTTEDQPSERDDNYRVGIIPYDGIANGSEALSDRLLIDNNSAPVATDVSISPPSPFSSDGLVADYVFFDENGDLEVDSVIRWYKNEGEQTNYGDQKEVPFEATRKDENWYFTIEPSDGKESGAMKTSPTVKIQNAPPEAIEVALTPAGATSDDNLEVSYKYNDADGDQESGTKIRWYRNNEEQVEYEDERTILRENTDKGDEWYFTVLVHDGIVSGQIVESDHAVIGNMPPEVRTLTIPPEGFRDITIKFDLVDADGDICSLEVEYRGGNADAWGAATIREPLTDIESNNLVTLTWDSVTDESILKATNFQIRITPNDGAVAGSTVVSGWITLDNNEPPVVSNLQVLPLEPTTTDNLQADYMYDDPDGISAGDTSENGSEIIWYKNGIVTDSKGRILPASATKRDESWHYTVRPMDGSKFGEQKTSPPVIIRNMPPFIWNNEVTIEPSAPGSGDTLTVRYDYRDMDEDSQSGTSIEWYKNGVLTLQTIFETNEDRNLSLTISKGEKWYAVVIPSDGIDFGNPVTSASVAVDNAVPIVEDVMVSVSPGEATVTYSLVDTDGDSCQLNVEYQGGSVQGASWETATVSGATTDVFPGTGLEIIWLSSIDEPGQSAENYKIRITPNDGVSTGISGLSSTFSFSNNSLPTASGVLILPEMPVTSDDLKADYVFVDTDGDREAKPEIRWYRDGFQDIKYNNLTILPSRATSSGERWYYTIRANDGKEYGRLQTSRDVIIENAPPEAISVVLTPDQPELDDQLVAHYTYVDADGDPEVDTKIQWYKDGLHSVEFDNFDVIPSVFTMSGDEWYFTVMTGDGLSYSVPQASNEVFISNEPPRASGLDISPSDPLTTHDLQGSYIYDDPERDPESGSKVIWYKSNVRQPKYDDTLKLPASATSKNQVWHFTAQPRDGKQFGTVQKSNPVFIGNTLPRAENLAVSPPYPLDKDDLWADYDFVDADGDIEGRTEVKWFKNDIWIPEYSSTQLLARVTSDGEIWHFTIQPKDDTNFGVRMVSSSVEIGNPVPRVNSLTIVPGVPLTTDDLKASYIYVDPKGVPESGSQISWYRNGIIQPEYTETILSQEATFKGDQWYFSVRPNNGNLFGEEQSSIPVTIVNSIPTLTNPTILPDNPTTDDNIAVNYVFGDADGDAEAGNEIRWYKNGTLQAAYNNMMELSADATRRDEEWYFTVRSRDDADFSGLVTALGATIGNGRPELTSLDILPIDPLTNDELKVLYTYIDTEGDAESGTEIRWFRNDAHQSEYDDLDTVPPDATARDDKWHCTISPRDGLDFGDLSTSPVLTIGNTSPVALEIIASSDQVLRDSSVDIISYGQDADTVDAGAALVCHISVRFGAGAWVDLPTEYVGIPEPGWTATFEPGPQAQLGEYDFRAKFIDAAGAESDWVERESMIAVGNALPVIDEFADDFHVPEDTIQEFDLRRYGADPEDGETLTWGLDTDSVDETLFQATISGNRFLEIQPVNNENGRDDITITLTDMDGGEFVKADVTIIVDPVNDPPSVPASIKITPVAPKTSDSLVCEVSGSTDPDADDVVVYRYQWYKDDVLQPNLKSNSVTYTRTAKDELWRCEVTPSDGLADGQSRSVEVTVVNTLPVITARSTRGDTKEITITFDLQDADGDSCDLKVEYRIKGKTWKTANVKESLRGVKPGTGLTLTWQSHLDVANVVTDDCRLKITPNDGALPGAPGESARFPLDNLPPTFTVTAVANPIHPRYVDVTVVSNEKLSEAPDISVDLGGEADSITLDVQSVADTSWTGMFVLDQGFDGAVIITVEGVDLVGNVGEAELENEFHIPSPIPKPSDYALGQNYPNPVYEDTRIPYQLAESFNVIIRIYSLTGQLVRTMDEGYKVAGFYLSLDKASYWDGKDDNGEMVASGLYFYHFKAGNFEAVKKMVVIR